jgi:Ala-tRNA(Pro) deacylase
VNLKALRAKLGESTLSFASPERLQQHLGLTPGSVSPFGLINDGANAVVVLLDTVLMQTDPLNFHPNINTATLTVARADFERFLSHAGNEVRLIDLDE